MRCFSFSSLARLLSIPFSLTLPHRHQRCRRWGVRVIFVSFRWFLLSSYRERASVCRLPYDRALFAGPISPPVSVSRSFPRQQRWLHCCIVLLTWLRSASLSLPSRFTLYLTRSFCCFSLGASKSPINDKGSPYDGRKSRSRRHCRTPFHRFLYIAAALLTRRSPSSVRRAAPFYLVSTCLSLSPPPVRFHR